VSVVNLLVLVVLAWFMVVVGRSRSLDTGTEEAIKASQSDDSQEELETTYHRLERLVYDNELFKDSELNLQRLARKLGIPARKVSRAVNAKTGGNISQWINDVRINAACDLLRDTDTSI